MTQALLRGELRPDPLVRGVSRLLAADGPRKLARDLAGCALPTKDIVITVAKQRPGQRLVLRIEPSDRSRPPNGDSRWFVKLYRGRTAMERAERARVLADVAEGAGIHLPRVLGSLPRFRGLVYEGGPGIPLRDLDGASLAAGFEVAGEVVGRLHACLAGAAAGFPDRSMEEEARHAEAALRTWQPELVPRFYQALCRLLAPRTASPEILIHGDLHPDQVLIRIAGAAGNGGDAEDAGGASDAGAVRDGGTAAGIATVIDWDGAGRAPAESDLGNFLAHVELESARGHWPPEAASAIAVRFLRGYQRTRSYHVAEVTRYRDLALLRLAALHANPAFGKCPPNAPGLAGALLARTEAAAVRIGA